MITNAYQVNALKELGVDVAKLGYVGLNLEQLPVKDFIPERWAYHAKDPKYTWVKGLDEKSHVTLLYGLLEKAHRWKDYVDEVLQGWSPVGSMYIKKIEIFDSTLPGEDYSCIVGAVESGGFLELAHKLLSFLPHVNTFHDYKPHVTLAYVQKDHRNEAKANLAHELITRELVPLDLDYGGKHQ